MSIHYAFLLLVSLLMQPKTTDLKNYHVKKISGDILISGKGDHERWKQANELTDFSYPWETGTPSCTSFKALHNDSWLYCLFTVDDKDIKLYIDKNDKSESVRSDRVEIFLRQNSTMSPYYCLEIDASARIFDCAGTFHRKLDLSWSWPKDQLLARASRSSNGYRVEIAISKKSLQALGLLTNNQIEAGLYRADCVALEGKDATFRWISWVKPESPTPDFHIPSSFGVLTLDQ